MGDWWCITYWICSPYPHDINTGEISLNSTDTAIVDSCTSAIYLTPAAPCTNINMSPRLEHDIPLQRPATSNFLPYPYKADIS